FFFSSRRRHTRWPRDWSSDVCSSDLVAARAGARITIIHRGSRPLEAFDPDLVDLLVKRTRDVGIGVELDAEVGGITVDAKRLVRSEERRVGKEGRARGRTEG